MLINLTYIPRSIAAPHYNVCTILCVNRFVGVC